MATNFNTMSTQPTQNQIAQNLMQMPGFQTQQQQYFPQPQGSIFMLNNSSEIGNIPIGAGLSAGICLADGTMYLKTLQNGAPMMLSYRLSPLEQVDAQGAQPDTNKKIFEYLKVFSDRLDKIEEGLKVNSKGGKLEWPL